MPRYRIHGLTIHLPISVGGLLPAPDGGPVEIDVAWTEAPEPDVAGAGSWCQIMINQSRRSFPIYSAWRDKRQGYLWQSAGSTRTVKYRMPDGLRRIEIWRNPSLSPLTLVRPSFGQALAFLLRARRRLLLHAASVDIGGRALLLVGPSGRGKSALTFELVRQGCRLLSDDMALPDLSAPIPTVDVGHGAVKLMPDSVAMFDGMRENNWPLAPGGIKREVLVTTQVDAGPIPVAAIVLLEPRGTTNSVVLNPVTAGDALLALNAYIHPGYLPVGALGQAELRSVFEQLSILVGRIRVMRLRRPDGFAAMPEASRMLIAAAAA